MKRNRWLLPITVTVVYTWLLGPIVVVLWLAVSESAVMELPPESYSLHWFRELQDQGAMWDGLVYSLVLAAVVAVISTVVGAMTALATHSSSKRWVVALESAFTGPLVVPAIVTGVALYIFLSQLSAIVGNPLVPSSWALVVAHVMITLPWAFRVIVTGLYGLPPNVERASMDLGQKAWGTWWRVTLPLIKPSLAGALILTFIFSFADLEISLFLVGPGNTTLPIAMVEYAYWRIDPVLAATATVQITLTGVLLLIVTRILKIQEAFSYDDQ